MSSVRAKTLPQEDREEDSEAEFAGLEGLDRGEADGWVEDENENRVGHC